MSVIEACRKPNVPALVKRTCPFILFFFYIIHAVAQTNISGIVNTYHKVVEVIPSKACLRVADATGLNVNTAVMVVQMKGAAISTANNNTFGDTTSLNGAGNYEIGTICYIIGDSIFLFHNLLNTYDVSAKVQLVQFAEYLSANVIDTIKASSWDSTAGTGGVIAIYADQDITLNAPIYADSSGYAGGSFVLYTGNCPVGTGWAYDASSTGSLEGAYKGESVANISATQDGAKGAPANGGGGGNNHNNSGAGGANLSPGGNGGGNGSSAPFTCITGGNYGRAGKALSSWNGTKIFMGGGGGAGHANNGSTSFNYGGNGGGLIFIWCNNLIGNNYSIRANGGNGGASQSDGAGGGGAGGTIIMNVSNYTNNVSITANGGNGGQSDDGGVSGRCFGGGGGGSGGAIYFTGSTPAVTYSVSAGTAGVEINGLSCGALVPAAAGSNGLIISNYSFSRSTDPAGYCQLLLPVKLIYFNGQSANHAILLNWKADHPELVEKFNIEKRNNNNEWITLASIVANNNSFGYSIKDVYPFNDNNFYRLKVIEKDGNRYYSEIRKIWFAEATIDFAIYPNPSRGKVYINGNLSAGEILQIVDINGRIIWQTRISDNRQESIVPFLQPGIYLVNHSGIIKKLVIY